MAICAWQLARSRRVMPERLQSAMAQETAEVPDCAERLISNSHLVTRLMQRISEYAPRLAVICGRGSSGHVGVHLRYLFETRLGLLTSAAAPSVFTAAVPISSPRPPPRANWGR
jgi:glucosamine--fructose-6-phosphate aminotransferase (isomerizing)